MHSTDQRSTYTDNAPTIRTMHDLGEVQVKQATPSNPEHAFGRSKPVNFAYEVEQRPARLVQVQQARPPHPDPSSSPPASPPVRFDFAPPQPNAGWLPLGQPFQPGQSMSLGERGKSRGVPSGDASLLGLSLATIAVLLVLAPLPGQAFQCYAPPSDPTKESSLAKVNLTLESATDSVLCYSASVQQGANQFIMSFSLLFTPLPYLQRFCTTSSRSIRRLWRWLYPE
eukprot:gene26443-17541_t